MGWGYKAVKNLTNTAKIAEAMLYLIPIEFQSCKFKEKMSPTKESIGGGEE